MTELKNIDILEINRNFQNIYKSHNSNLLYFIDLKSKIHKLYLKIDKKLISLEIERAILIGEKYKLSLKKVMLEAQISALTQVDNAVDKSIPLTVETQTEGK